MEMDWWYCRFHVLASSMLSNNDSNENGESTYAMFVSNVLEGLELPSCHL